MDIPHDTASALCTQTHTQINTLWYPQPEMFLKRLTEAYKEIMGNTLEMEGMSVCTVDSPGVQG